MPEAPSPRMARLGREIARRPALALAAVLAAVVAGAVVGARLGVDSGNEALFLAKDPALPALREFQRLFAADQTVIVALRGPILAPVAGRGLSIAGLERVEALREALARIPNVTSTLALTTVRNIYQFPGAPEASGFAPYEWVKDGERPGPGGEDAPYTVTDFAREVLAEPLFAGNLISRDGRMAAIVCEVSSRDAATVAAIRAAARAAEADDFLERASSEPGAPSATSSVAPTSPNANPEARGLKPEASFEAFVAGNPVQRVEFAETIDRDQRVFVPLIAVTLGLLSLFLFRQVWGVALPLAIVGASVAATQGVAVASGVKLNAVSSMLTPVVMVVSIATSVNFLMAFAQAKAELARQRDGRVELATASDYAGQGRVDDESGPAEAKPRWEASRARLDAVAAAIGRVGLPCLFTTATCVAGFGSLAVSDVPAIQDFGAMCAVGVALSYALALLALPPLLALEWPAGPGSLHAREGKIEALLARATPFFERRRKLVLALAAAAVVAALAGVARIRVETDILGQLPSNGDLARSTRAIDEALSGADTIEVLLTGPAGTYRSLAGVRGLAALEDWLGSREGVAKTFSAADILARVNEVKKGKRALPEDETSVAYDFGLLDRAAGRGLGRREAGARAQSGAGDPLRSYMAEDGSAARLTARLRAMPSSKVDAILRGVADEAKRALPEGAKAQPTGEFVLLQDMTAALPYAMLVGLCWATLLIVGSMGLLFRSARLAAVAAIPASIPILGVYGIMGWVGIWLSVPTAMISSVVLGLAVDSTILFLSRYRDERAEGRPRREAVEGMLLHAGQSVTYSNLTLIFGFAVGVVSRFPPIRDFGTLTSLTVAASYLGALCLLPALIFSAPAGTLRDERTRE